MNDKLDRRLSAALQAQASGLGTGSPARSTPDARQLPPIRSGRAPARAQLGQPSWAVLAEAVLLGALAGGLAGVISVW
ncbi:MAG: hypothetical protein M3228_03320 [Actinomycetota bacterium]|nr:hypothetical protein [Actinomycetota bacterium]